MRGGGGGEGRGEGGGPGAQGNTEQTWGGGQRREMGREGQEHKEILSRHACIPH